MVGERGARLERLDGTGRQVVVYRRAARERSGRVGGGGAVVRTSQGNGYCLGKETTMPATSSFEGRLLHEKAELEGRLLEGEETIRALSELIDLLPDDQFRGLRIQWHNAKARG